MNAREFIEIKDIKWGKAWSGSTQWLAQALDEYAAMKVKEAAQQERAADGAYCSCPKDMHRQYQSAEVCDVCQKPRR